MPRIDWHVSQDFLPKALKELDDIGVIDKHILPCHQCTEKYPYVIFYKPTPPTRKE